MWHVLIINKYWLWNCDVFDQYFDNSIKWQTQTICKDHFCFDKILIAPRWQTVFEIYDLFPLMCQCVSRYVELVSLTLAPVKHFHSVVLFSSIFISSKKLQKIHSNIYILLWRSYLAGSSFKWLHPRCMQWNNYKLLEYKILFGLRELVKWVQLFKAFRITGSSGSVDGIC